VITKTRRGTTGHNKNTRDTRRKEMDTPEKRREQTIIIMECRRREDRR
jgi:hypothetical protein